VIRAKSRAPSITRSGLIPFKPIFSARLSDEHRYFGRPNACLTFDLITTNNHRLRRRGFNTMAGSTTTSAACAN
jgi:hypothetical protein